MKRHSLIRAAALVALTLLAVTPLSACTGGPTAPGKGGHPTSPATSAPMLRAPASVPTDMSAYAYDAPTVSVALRSESQVGAVADALAPFPAQVTITGLTGKRSVVATWRSQASTAQVAAMVKAVRKVLPKAAVTRGTSPVVGLTLSTRAPKGFTPAARKSLNVRLNAAAGGPFEATLTGATITVDVIARGLTAAAKDALVKAMASTLGVDVGKVSVAPIARKAG